MFIMIEFLIYLAQIIMLMISFYVPSIGSLRLDLS